jgi:hypothetical protein
LNLENHKDSGMLLLQGNNFLVFTGVILKKITFLLITACFYTMGTLEAHADSASPDSPQNYVVEAQELTDSGIVIYKYQYSDGSMMEVPVPPSEFDPFAASDSELKILGIPERPSIEPDLMEWEALMATYSNPTAPKVHDTGVSSATAKYGTMWGKSWGGYFVGAKQTFSSKYVAVKGNFVVPYVASACDGQRRVAAWVGLGGVDEVNTSSLVQQGMGWCNPLVDGNTPLPLWQPFTEFAETEMPKGFCGYTDWYFSPGDVIYNNMSYQQSTNKAYFYMQNQTTGVVHFCNITHPQGWTFNGATAEWIVEQLHIGNDYFYLANYGSLTFTNAQAELGSNSTWVTIASQAETKSVTGIQEIGSFTQVPTLLGANGMSFTMNWIKGSY